MHRDLTNQAARLVMTTPQITNLGDALMEVYGNEAEAMAAMAEMNRVDAIQQMLGFGYYDLRRDEQGWALVLGDYDRMNLTASEGAAAAAFEASMLDA